MAPVRCCTSTASSPISGLPPLTPAITEVLIWLSAALSSRKSSRLSVSQTDHCASMRSSGFGSTSGASGRPVSLPRGRVARVASLTSFGSPPATWLCPLFAVPPGASPPPDCWSGLLREYQSNRAEARFVIGISRLVGCASTT